MTAKKAKTGPTDEVGQQPTPDSDALIEVEGANAGAGSTLAQIGAALRAAGVSASREQLDRAFTRDATDVDIGYHEGLRHLQLKDFASMTNLSNVLNHVTGIKAMNKESQANDRDSDSTFWTGIEKAGGVFHSNLLKAYGLETDNEVLTTVALAEVVKQMANKVDAIEAALLSVKK